MPSGPSRGGNAAEIDRLALALAKEPGSKAFIPLAEEYGKAGMWQEAAAVLEDGLKTYPNFITAMVALGRVYDQLNQPVKAKAILEEAVKLSPENLRAHRTLAKIYVAQGAKESALRSCQVILSVNAQDEEALSLRAALGTPEPATAQTVREPPAAATGGRPAGESPSLVKPALAAAESDSQEPSTKGAPLRMTGAESSSAPTRPAAALQLERWLGSIQARRRDREPPRYPAAS
jgi:tetratricopeptide (TPR) repeat protein